MSVLKVEQTTESLAARSLSATGSLGDRRRYIRRYFQAPLMLRSQSGIEDSGQLQNMSMSGMMITTTMPADLRQPINVSLDSIFSVNGFVVRLTDTGFAINYVLSEAERVNLAKSVQGYIDEHLLIPRVIDRRSGTRGRRNTD